MPFTVVVDHAKHWVVARAEGPVTLDDVRARIHEERRKDGLAYGELIDAQGYVPAFSAEDVRTMIHLLRQAGAESALGPTAIVVDTDFGYGMLRKP